MCDRDHSQITRRDILSTLGVAVGAVLTGACGGSPSSPSPATTTTTTTGAPPSSACVVTASETAGPYPDNTGMITKSAFFRRDITEGKAGTPLTLTLTVVAVGSGCTPVANAIIEVWQCDAAGNYSEYSQPGFNGVGQTFLRGLQITDANGQVTFNTIYPGWYSGRATHIHVEVFVNGASIKTTQVAFPENVTAVVYGSGVYASKGQNSTRNSSDNVFSDGTITELATVSGSTAGGYTAALTIGV